MNISFKSFIHSSPLYEESIVLRNRILIEAVGRHEDCRDFDFPEKDFSSPMITKQLMTVRDSLLKELLISEVEVIDKE